jgi:N-glycosylase/DNA lyase
MDVSQLEIRTYALRSVPSVSASAQRAIREFERNGHKNDRAWFNELCFCLLTANCSARTVLSIWEDLCQSNGFTQLSLADLSATLKRRGYRFYNKRAEYIVESRWLTDDIKARIQSFDSSFEAREWLVSEVKGLGLKESSHFLRNVGYKDLAILDRHILRVLRDHGLIEAIPGHLSREFYYSVEQKLRDFAAKTKLTLAELDLFLWYMKTGKILK